MSDNKKLIAVRTIGSFRGSLKDMKAKDLGQLSAMKKSNLIL